MRDQVTTTASAAEEQSTVTQGMSSNKQDASGAVSTVSSTITEIATAALQAAQAVNKAKKAAWVLVR